MPLSTARDLPPDDIPALILAAGRGERLRPITDTCPKPLVQVGGQPLIAWHLHALARAGVRRVVINVAWIGQQLVDAIGDGSAFGLQVSYSREDLDFGHALETAGGIAQALPLLGCGPDDPFWLASGDVLAPDFPFDRAEVRRLREEPALDGRIWLVRNPPWHPAGDFALDAQGRVRDAPGSATAERLTYANLALLRPRLLAGVARGVRRPLGPLLREAASRGALGGARHEGRWHNVGTPDDLRAAREALP